MDNPIEALGCEYVQPEDRPVAWAAMAAELTDDGRSLPQIADALCVDQPTAVRLLALAGHAI